MAAALRALVVDDGDESLGRVAVRLMRLGLDVHYASDHAEAWLLSEEVARRVGVVLLPPSICPDAVADLARRLRAFAPNTPHTFVVIGKRPDDETRKRLREKVELALWEPYHEGELRSVLSAAIAPRVRHAEARRHPRIPTLLLARASMGLLRTDAIVTSLSLGGAFLEGPDPFPAGSQVTLEIDLRDGVASVQACVAYESHATLGAPDRPTGMGMEFTSLDGVAEERLRRFLAGQEERFAV